MLIKLPNGLIDGLDHFNYCEIDELRGKHQNYLANRQLVEGNIGHLPLLLKDLIVSLQTKEGIQYKGKIEEVVYKLPSGDLETILIKVREKSFGPRYYFEADCPHCGANNKNLRVDLSSLELKEQPIEEILKPKTITLSKLQQEVELKPLFLKDLFEVIKIAKNKQDSVITSLVSTSVKRIGTNVNITSSDIDNIPASDIIEIEEAITNNTLEGTIDTNITIECKECNKEFQHKLQVFDASFFFHSKA